MKRSITIGLAVVFGLFSIWINADASEKVVTLKVTNHFPVGHLQNILLDQWSKDLEKRAAGKVKVNYYPSGTLVPATQTYDGVVKGIADVGNHVLGYTVGRFPFTEGLDLPLGYPSGSVATKMINAFYNKFKPKELDAIKILWFHAQGPGLLHTKTKPVSKLDDLKGMKVRTFGSNARFMAALGGTPVAMPMGDVYDALSRGIVDGLMCAYEALEGFRTGEHVKFSTENFATAYTAIFVVFISKDKWNALPQDVQTIVDQMSGEYMEKYAKMWDDIDKSGKEYLLKRGVKFVSLSKEEETHWVERAKPLFDDYVKRMQEKGLPGDQALKFANDYLAQHRK